MNRYNLTNAGIDVANGIRRFNNNKQLFERYLVLFPEDEHFEMLCQELERNDYDAAFRAAHALKGVSGTLSLVRLHQAVSLLVEELRAQKTEHLDELMTEVTKAYQLACDEIRKERENLKQ